MFQIVKSEDNEEKSKIANYILRSLPDWFGIEESIVEYVQGVRESDFYVAYHLDKPVGFISIKYNNQYTVEIYVIGILKDYHNRGIGKALLNAAEEPLYNSGYKFLMVKTLSDSHPDEGYNNTRMFYKKVGFYPLQEIIEVWGKENPCLIMIKYLSR